MSKTVVSASLPKHIAIVMDGNGRWAKKRFLPRLAGHQQGVAALRRCVTACADRGIEVLSVFAFSSENWKRPEDEVSGIFELFGKALGSEVPAMHEAGIQLHFVGDTASFSPKLQAELKQAEQLTANNTKLVFNICFNYGGRWDIVQAVQKVQATGQAVSQDNLSQHLALAHVPDPDLFIRTGDELRISNFLLWQTAYSELYFSPVLWPEFDAQALDAALAEYARRERRFGKTSEQLQSRTAHSETSQAERHA